MAGKKIKTAAKNFSLLPQFPKYAGYADYFLSTPVSVQVKNDGAEAAQLRIFIESDGGLIVPYETQTEVPFESAVSLTADGVFSPLFLAENDALTPCTVTVRAEQDGREVCRAQSEIVALPYDWWEGLEGNAERLAAFVRPRLSDCAAVLSDAKFSEEAEYLAGYAAQVHAFCLYRGARFSAPNIVVHEETPRAIEGGMRVERLIAPSGTYEVSGVFFLKNSAPPAALVGGLQTENGAVVAARDGSTNLRGLFAAGDVTGRPYQYAKAAGEGLVAAYSAHAYLQTCDAAQPAAHAVQP